MTKSSDSNPQWASVHPQLEGKLLDSNTYCALNAQICCFANDARLKLDIVLFNMSKCKLIFISCLNQRRFMLKKKKCNLCKFLFCLQRSASKFVLFTAQGQQLKCTMTLTKKKNKLNLAWISSLCCHFNYKVAIKWMQKAGKAVDVMHGDIFCCVLPGWICRRF